ncbi:sigma factor [Evtepia gabavorous]|uniref:sigma factor n=1 Tax=Evtepia gabavorous TaxID=2211183 RepID=UPI003991AE6A
MPVTLDRGEAERLVHAYSDLILRLSYTYLKSTDDAQDICQTVFLCCSKAQAFSRA